MKRQYIFTLRVSHDIPPKYVVDCFFENVNYDKQITLTDMSAAKELCGINIGKDISTTLFAIGLRLRFNMDMIQHIMAVIVEDIELTADSLDNIINNMSTERLRIFIEEAKI